MTHRRTQPLCHASLYYYYYYLYQLFVLFKRLVSLVSSICLPFYNEFWHLWFAVDVTLVATFVNSYFFIVVAYYLDHRHRNIVHCILVVLYLSDFCTLLIHLSPISFEHRPYTPTYNTIYMLTAWLAPSWSDPLSSLPPSRQLSTMLSAWVVPNWLRHVSLKVSCSVSVRMYFVIVTD